jgi:hypothetical protein
MAYSTSEHQRRDRIGRQSMATQKKQLYDGKMRTSVRFFLLIGASFINLDDGRCFCSFSQMT